MFRFQLRTLLIVFTLLIFGAAFLGWRLHQNRMRELAVKTIKERGGQLVQNKQTKKVERVYLTGKTIDDAKLNELIGHMKYLSDLNELDLVRISATDKSVEPLAGLRQLREIYIYETPISETGIKNLQRLLPDVTVKVEEPEPVASKMMAMKIYRHAITALAGSSDKKQVATGDGSGQVRIWDMDGPRPLESWQAHQNWVFDISYSPDGSMIATAGDNVVKLWNRSNKSLVHQFDGPKNDVHDIAFTPDGKYLIAASDDRLIRIWDIHSKRLAQTLTGHSRQIPGIALNASGDLLASVSRDQTVRLWSIPGGQPVAVLSGHESDVMSVAFNASGEIIATGDQNGAVRLWSTDSQTMIGEFASSLGSVFDLAFDRTGEALSACGVNGIQCWDLVSGTTSCFNNEQSFVSRMSYSVHDRLVVTTNITGELSMLDPHSFSVEQAFRTMHGQRGLGLNQ